MPWPEVRRVSKEIPDVPQFSFKLLSYLFLLAVVVQFFLAGYGMTELGNEGWDAHRSFGYAALHLIPLLMFGAAIWAKMGKTTIVMVGVLFVLIVIQPFLAREDVDGSVIRAMHVVVALFIFMLGFHISQRAGPLRMPRREA
jgi:hypothetical protein